MKPIHVQAEEWGLHLPIGCSAKVIRFMGYEIPEEVMDCEVYGHQRAISAACSMDIAQPTGYVWYTPPGSLKVAVRGPQDPMGTPMFRWVYVPGRQNGTYVLADTGEILASPEEVAIACEADRWYATREMTVKGLSAEDVFRSMATSWELIQAADRVRDFLYSDPG